MIGIWNVRIEGEGERRSRIGLNGTESIASSPYFSHWLRTASFIDWILSTRTRLHTTYADAYAYGLHHGSIYTHCRLVQDMQLDLTCHFTDVCRLRQWRGRFLSIAFFPSFSFSLPLIYISNLTVFWL